MYGAIEHDSIVPDMSFYPATNMK